jgi:hypothetical protein
MSPILKGVVASQISGHLASPSSYESIATVTVGSGGSSSISFSSIPATYKHLQLRMFGQTAATNRICIAYNSDTNTSNYNSHLLEGDGGTAYAVNVTGVAGNTYYTQTATYPFASIVDILDYSSTSKYKTQRAFSGNDRNGGGTVSLISSLWLNTTAVNALTITVATTSFQQYCSFALYGIKG